MPGRAWLIQVGIFLIAEQLVPDLVIEFSGPNRAVVRQIRYWLLAEIHWRQYYNYVFDAGQRGKNKQVLRSGIADRLASSGLGAAVDHDFASRIGSVFFRRTRKVNSFG